jgi:hypothetical protein
MMLRHVPLRTALVAAAFPLLGATGAQGQDGAPGRGGSEWLPMVPIGSWAEDRMRLDQLLGARDASGYLLRTPSTTAGEVVAATRWSFVLPEVRLVRNSDIPFSLNEGGLHAGRGSNLLIRGGIRGDHGRFSATLAPVLITEDNRDFQTLIYPGGEPRHMLSSPWHWGFQSADIPQRFGTRARLRGGLGDSRVSAAVGPLRTGASTEPQWWGPGIRNALVMSNNAGGFPHLFLQTERPWATRLGSFEGKWIVGRLSGSGYFVSRDRGTRILTGLGATFQPAGAPGATVGVARVVYGREGGFERAFDLFRGVGHPNHLPADGAASSFGGRDQIFSLFGRWIFPASGLEVYGEWARTDLPLSLRDLIVDPQRSQGYTMGLQWVRPLRDDALLRLQTEATTLEQTERDGLQAASFYTSRAVAEGYTHRGQVIGAAIGPGASAQWAAADYLRTRWRVGVLAGRIRWENDVMYRRARVPSYHAHDVTALAGVRGGIRIGPFDAAAEGIVARRANYLFQNDARGWEDLRAIDIANRTLRLTLSPAPAPRRAGPPVLAVPPPPYESDAPSREDPQPELP